MAKKTLTSSVYTFERLRTADYLYVDKTSYLWNLIQLDGGMYFRLLNTYTRRTQREVRRFRTLPRIKWEIINRE